MTQYARGKKIAQPTFLSLAYEKYVLSELKKTKQLIKTNLLGDLSAFNKESKLIRKDDYLDDIERSADGIRSNLELERLLLLVPLQNIAFKVLGFASQSVVNSISDIIRISPRASFANSQIKNDLIKSWAYTNSRLITSLNENLINDVINIIQYGLRSRENLSDISKELQTKFNKTTKKAHFLAKNQINAFNNEQVFRELTSFSIDLFEWLTKEDERVRKSHAVLNRKVCSISDPKVYKNLIDSTKWLQKTSIGGVEKQPSEDYNCRCGCRPIIKL